MAGHELSVGTIGGELLLMSTLILGRDELVAEWVAHHLPGMTSRHDFGPCSAIGFKAGNEFIAGVVFSNFRKGAHGNDVSLSIYSTSPKWASRGTLRAVFSYAHHQLGCVRVTAITAKSNKRARKFLTRLGFVQEGTARRAFDGRAHAMIYGMMLPDECKWLTPDGWQEPRVTARAA